MVGAPKDLLDEAVAASGLDDFGDDSFREGFEILVDSLRTETRLNSLGEMAMRRQLVGHLIQRNKVEDWYRRHPEIGDEPLMPALIGLGLPRTGSTALSALLAEDPDVRSLRLFEATRPCPPPSTVVGEDPRKRDVEGERRSGIAVRRRLRVVRQDDPGPAAWGRGQLRQAGRGGSSRRDARQPRRQLHDGDGDPRRRRSHVGQAPTGVCPGI